jgi:hypothetical protein
MPQAICKLPQSAGLLKRNNGNILGDLAKPQFMLGPNVDVSRNGENPQAYLTNEGIHRPMTT